MGTLQTKIQNAQINAQISDANKELPEIIKVSKSSFNDICHGAFDRDLIKDACISEILSLYNITLQLVHERDIIETIQDIIAVLPLLAVRYFPFIFSRYFVTKWVVGRRHKLGMYLLDFPLE